MTDTRGPVSGDIAIMAMIGQVCLQWARLEMALIGLLCHVEPMETEKAYIIFGGLDILPRANMIINLARHNKVHPPILKKIVAIRTTLQKGLLDRRNLVVHGAHREMEGDETTLTMIRWKGDKRHTTLSVIDIGKLGNEIHQLGNEVWSIMEAINARDFKIHLKENLANPVS